MNEKLIDSLVADLRPVRRGAMTRMFGIAGVIGIIFAAAIMVPWIGLRADIATAPMTLMFWIKFGYTAAIGLLGAVATLSLTRPVDGSRVPLLVTGGLFVVTLAGGTWQWAMAPDALKQVLALGSTALVCPLYIIALSAPILALMLAVARRFAPSSPTLAGLAAGLAAGGAGASVYAMHCGENGLLFLALWYSLGIALVAFAGATIGRFVLRW